jgi:guanosine-3',5'-bis(diphosphate) 3'-pyrophosphohydrolase
LTPPPPAPPTGFRLVLDAVSFAGRAHLGQLRKDRQTPYACHPFRVCLIVHHVFGVGDPEVLAAAVLHDTVEDTTTDFDDLAERFGPRVAAWVAALSKDKRLPEPEREVQYAAGLAAADWPVQVCKLADVYDNLIDSAHLTPERRPRTFARVRQYLDALRSQLKDEARTAFEIVELMLRERSA